MCTKQCQGKAAMIIQFLTLKNIVVLLYKCQIQMLFVQNVSDSGGCGLLQTKELEKIVSSTLSHICILMGAILTICGKSTP